MVIRKKYAKPISYNSKKRDRKKIKAIVIHYTGNVGDTAINNATYFATTNTRYAGAHFFIDKKGEVVKSVPMNKIAYSVGGMLYNNLGGKYYTIYNNDNTVSIELCDCTKKEPYNIKEIKQLKKLIKYIRKYCPNAKKIIRHYDVNGKNCPMPLINDYEWKKFLTMLGEK